ncbi:NAD(P)/FAD-dependent oxidoreductase [Marinisporobacter balticus]|uniref:Flavin-dependent dehydrogenase n=1 Tax=Marinisporobacter balticus TaxID=2018667 RepID=A0A4R2KUY3_9FIRM|nr:NAD(P)/FAD-dependent oxidoreductase [Marinisporobacter balticus]TCO74959.1 flavin-dependent dehydrogenase [Marinisporobacter balticus]
MKVAIIGAGLSGLSCAHELEMNGINPTIYEKNDYIGEAHPHVGGDLRIVHRPIKDSITYYKKLGIELKPLNKVNRIVHYSPNKRTVINGDLGYFLKRGKEQDSCKNQIYAQLKKSKILFNQLADYENLSKKYDYVVIANGNSNFTEELGCWQQWVTTHVRGAIVLGDFDPNALIVWINKDYCKNGYVYLTPFNNKRASLISITTDVNEKQIDWFWEAFLYTENIKYTIIEEFKLQHKTGYVYPHKTENIYFVGNAAGSIDPFLGFGVMNSITTGIMAARSILYGKDYEKLIKDRVVANMHMHAFRKAYNRMSNKDYDLLITAIGLPGIKQLFYDTGLNVVEHGGGILGMMNKIKKNENTKNKNTLLRR